MPPDLREELQQLVAAAVEVVRQEFARCQHSLEMAPALRRRCEEARGRADAWRCIARHEVLVLESTVDRLAEGAVQAAVFGTAKTQATTEEEQSP